MVEQTYLNLDLQIEKAETGYRAHVLDSPSGRVQADFIWPFSERDVFDATMTDIQTAIEAGQRLYNAVFSADVGQCLQLSMKEAENQGKKLRIRLRLSQVPELIGFPWEYLHNRLRQSFFALSSETSLVRYPDVPQSDQLPPEDLPLRMLVVISSPEGHPEFDAEREWTTLRETLGDSVSRKHVILERLSMPTLPALQRRLQESKYHVLHFVGHGFFDQNTQESFLILQDEQGREHRVRPQQLGVILDNDAALRLVFLNACHGAKAGCYPPFTSMAQGLVEHGIPTVIAMQFAITDRAANTLAREFYAGFSKGELVDASLAKARRAVFALGDTSAEWATPVLYMRAVPGFVERRKRLQIVNALMVLAILLA